MNFISGFDRTLEVKPNSWVVLVHDGKLATLNSTLLVPFQSLGISTDTSCITHYLGDYLGNACFLVILHARVNHPSFEYSNLRSYLGQVDDCAFAVASKALQYSHWLESHRYCGRCGNLTRDVSHERALECSQCNALYYPRISPCVIGLVWHKDKILLAHNASFQQGKYSILAGFVEPGETAEQALCREIKEEVGVNVFPPTYICSQAWPFPSQLMLGFFAQYKGGDIKVDGDEILHADWYGIDKLPSLPGPLSIAGQLIQRFVRSRERVM